MKLWKPYWAIVSSRFRLMLQYRAAALAGVATQIFFGIVRMMVFEAFFQSSNSSQPMTRDDVVTYIWLGQAMLLLILLAADHDVLTMIYTGSVAYEMVKPMDLYNMWYTRALGNRLAPLLLRGIPIIFVSSLFFELRPPVSVQAAVLFLISTVCALLLATSIVVLLNISLLWTISGDGISRLVPPLIFLFSGITVPLPFFPEWLQPLISMLPLRGLIDTPFQIYLGRIAGTEALAGIAHQWIWIAVLIIGGRMLLNHGVRRLVVQGG